ncbi:hypothetical protein BU15DRAFT_54217 [Melanogaster broomeanus]|nr:hypothetical protein BU15DRAFT_54217 [Melanogaster broomeanus]
MRCSCKANTLLVDHLFSPAPLLAELIEKGANHVMAAGLSNLDAAAIVTHRRRHPRQSRSEPERNREHYRSPCEVHRGGSEWETNSTHLLHLSHVVYSSLRYDMVIMLDLFHCHVSHDVFALALKSLLAKSPRARVYVAAEYIQLSHPCV